MGVRRRAGTPWFLIAAIVIATFMLFVYVSILLGQGSRVSDAWPFIAAFGIGIHVAVWAAVSQGRRRKVLARVAGSLFLILGVLGLFSIGVPLVAAALCCFVQSALKTPAEAP